MKNNFENQNIPLISSGFTLIEVIAAVAVLSIGLVGGLTAITKNLKNISSSENRIIAANLAAEGIELARNIRDTNFLRVASGVPGADWKDGLVLPGLTKVKLGFFCGGITETVEGKNPPLNTQNWNSTLSAGSGCSANKCQIYMYKLNGDIDENALCYSDNFGNNPSYSGTNYRVVNPRTEFYRLVTATKIDDNSVKIESFVKYKLNGVYYFVPAVQETFYNWK